MTRMRLMAGVEVPATAVVDRAIDHARHHCEPYLFNHVMRSWLFAARLAQLRERQHDAEVLAVATLLHDVTLNESFAGPRRFEVEAADIARDFARSAGFEERRAQLVWDAVALNSTPSIGLHKEAEVALCTAGIGLDVIGFDYDRLPRETVAGIVSVFPRLAMKRRMSHCFCHIAAHYPGTTYDNFVRDYGERHVPGYAAPSVVDLVDGTPFEE
ncbi:HD domain-containing protein [Aurantimonas sp. 22II-16-19i]|uniref:HD domain-containing protein n=1 Tax=Aurantimonas sp. 22II-16-19i TaxID=1317114 RepID=UPI00111BE091|nr:HD domain-containing protein [Aurantimonas sp. 22II-16-19i]